MTADAIARAAQRYLELREAPAAPSAEAELGEHLKGALAWCAARPFALLCAIAQPWAVSALRLTAASRYPPGTAQGFTELAGGSNR